jgi:hypothetical protein
VLGAGTRERAKRPMDDLPEETLRIPRDRDRTERIPRDAERTERISAPPDSESAP